MPDPLVRFADLDFRLHYRTFLREGRSYVSTTNQRRGFVRQLAKKTSEPDLVINIGWCQRCCYPGNKLTMYRVDARQLACRDCIGLYSTCGGCNEMTRTDYMYTTVDPGSRRACPSCISRRFSYCTSCDGYYNRANRNDHRHGAVSCCTSPMKSFQIRNNGDDLLANDTRVSVAIPAGEISEEGLDNIKAHVRNQQFYCDEYAEQRKWIDLSNSLTELGTNWQTKDGNYAKRLSRHAYKSQSLKVPPKLMTLVGTIARDHSTGVEFDIETTRELNLSAGEFGHEESCLWQSYSNGRCTLKTNGGFGIRAFAGDDVIGRAWVMPMRKLDSGSLTPTFDTKSADAFIVFNGYGKLSGYVPARLLSQMMGMTYRKIGFYCNPIYINSEAGYIIGAEEVVAPHTDGRLEFSLTAHATLFTSENKELVNV